MYNAVAMRKYYTCTMYLVGFIAVVVYTEFFFFLRLRELGSNAYRSSRYVAVGVILCKQRAKEFAIRAKDRCDYFCASNARAQEFAIRVVRFCVILCEQRALRLKGDSFLKSV